MTGEPQPQTHIAVLVSDTPFCAYFKYNSKTTGHLQFYYTPNDFITTMDALFHVKSSKADITYKLQPHTYIALSLFSVEYLGHHISKEGIHVLPIKAEAIADAPTPTNIT